MSAYTERDYEQMRGHFERARTERDRWRARVRELEAIQAAALEALRTGKDGEWKTVRADTARELLSGKISPAGWGRERR